MRILFQTSKQQINIIKKILIKFITNKLSNIIIKIQIILFIIFYQVKIILKI